MAVISIVLGCFIGFIAGVFSVVFQDATLWQGFVIYLQASALLSVAFVAYLAFDQTFLRPNDIADFDTTRDKGPPEDPLTQAQIDSFNAQMNAPLPDLALDEDEDRKSA